MFDQIIRESGFTKELLRSGREEGEQAGRLKGEQEGPIYARRDDILAIVTTRFPQIQQATQERLSQLDDITLLHKLLVKVATAPDEAAVRTILGLPQS